MNKGRGKGLESSIAMWHRLRRMKRAELLFAALCFSLSLSACDSDDGDDDGDTQATGTQTSSTATGDTTGTSTNPFSEVFKIDGVDSMSDDKVSVSTFTADRVAVNFGVQLLTPPSDYSFFLEFDLDSAKTSTGTFGKEAVKSVQGLLRNASTAETFSTTWENGLPADVMWDLAVADGKITASWTGPVAPLSTGMAKAVVASIVEIPSNKK